MRFVTFAMNGGARVGLDLDNGILDLHDADPTLPPSLKALIAAGEAALTKVSAAAATTASRRLLPKASLRLLPVIPDPGKIICLGLNYADHAKEGGFEVPDYPAVFMRCASSLAGPFDALVRPAESDKFDYEVELLAVIGRRCRRVSEAEALAMVFGYTVFNDATLRDYQRRTTQWTIGKNFDGTGPMGPALVSADTLPPGAKGLGIRSRLNGAVLQESNTDNMIFSVARTVALMSEVMTLEPGDVIAMGTPEGVGHARKPPLWMKPGDLLESEIDGIGVMRNRIVDEAAAVAPMLEAV